MKLYFRIPLIIFYLLSLLLLLLLLLFPLWGERSHDHDVPFWHVY